LDIDESYLSGAIDLSQFSVLTNIDLRDNDNITSIILPEAPITNLNLNDNDLTQEAVDYILEWLDESGVENGYVDLEAGTNAEPGEAGSTAIENLLEKATLTNINQAFSSDITYFEIDEIFYFITFILDCFSRRILGYAASNSLTTEQTTLPALQMAIKTRKNKLPLGIIFHSDGGGQYYDKEFIKLTTMFGFKNSMCEMAYQNGKAERVNGIIKNNYLKHKIINNFDDLVKILDHTVSLYNNERPHKSLNYKTPMLFEKELLNLQQQNKPTMIESFDGYL
jgi:hypothetical protein